jgi:lactoylglutathione lyase
MRYFWPRPRNAGRWWASASGARRVNATSNVKRAVPFFRVSNLADSLRFYVDGLGFTMTSKWVHEGRLRWCWLELGGAALMLQESAGPGHDSRVQNEKVGDGVSIYFICDDALCIYRDVTARGLHASTPVVGNAMWVTTMFDPDGYRIEFESPTDVPEETVYEGDGQPDKEHHGFQ